jgi:hypothetical protein
MITLLTTQVTTEYPPVSDSELAGMAERTLEIATLAIQEYLPQLILYPHVTAEEGSVSLMVRVVGTATVIYFAIGQFGDFVAGVEAILDLSRRTGAFIVQRIERDVVAQAPHVVRRRVDPVFARSLKKTIERIEVGEVDGAAAYEQIVAELEKSDGAEAANVAGTVCRPLREITPRSVHGRPPSEWSAAAPDMTHRAGVSSLPNMSPKHALKEQTRSPGPKGPRPLPRRIEVWVDTDGRRRRRWSTG